MNKLKKALLVIAIAVTALVVVAVLFLGQIIKTGVNTVGPKVAGVPVKLEKATVNPLSGLVQIKGLLIGNPEGFNTPSAMELNDFKVKVKLASLLTDTIVVEQILIDSPQITYEKGLKSSNLSTLQEKLAPAKTEEKPAPEAQPEPKKKGAAKKVIIEDFQLNGAKVNVTLTALGGKKLEVPLPPVQLKDIGKKSNGASPAEVISELMGSITKAVGEAVTSAGAAAGDALKGAGGAASDAAKGATDAAKDAAESIKKGLGGLLGK